MKVIIYKKSALQLKLNLFELQKSLTNQLIDDITNAITAPPKDTKEGFKPFKAQNNLRQLKHFSSESYEQIKYFISDIIENLIKSPENSIFDNNHSNNTKELQDIIYNKLKPLISQNDSGKYLYQETSEIIAEIIIDKNSSYNKIICNLYNNIKSFKPKNIQSSLKNLACIEESLTCTENQAVLRRSYENRKLTDTILKEIRGLILACTIIPVLIAGAIYLLKPTINGYKYKNFSPIWSGIKNGKFTNHTKGKDFALSMRSMVNKCKDQKQIPNQAIEIK